MKIRTILERRNVGREALVFDLGREIKSCKNMKIKKVLRMVRRIIKSSKETEIKNILLLLRDLARVLAEAKKREGKNV